MTTLIQKAASVINPRKVKDRLIGDVGCALITDNGNTYLGVCGDLNSNTFCAEKIAVGAMLTAGESRIEKIVAVWKDENGDSYVIAPCGNCRELLRQVNEANLDAKVIMSEEKEVPLRDLLPHHDSWEKVDV